MYSKELSNQMFHNLKHGDEKGGRQKRASNAQMPPIHLKRNWWPLGVKYCFHLAFRLLFARAVVNFSKKERKRRNRGGEDRFSLYGPLQKTFCIGQSHKRHQNLIFPIFQTFRFYQTTSDRNKEHANFRCWTNSATSRRIESIPNRRKWKPFRRMPEWRSEQLITNHAKCALTQSGCVR